MSKVKIGDFLHRIKRSISLNPNDEYKLVTIKMHHKGVILRGLKNGSDIKSKMYEVKEGDFILSGIDARNGAFGIVSNELDGAIVTNDFWYFSLNEEIIDKYFFLELTSTSWFDEICRLGSDGTTQRIRLQKDKFFNQEINLPPLNEQQDFISQFIQSKTINTKIDQEIETQQTLLKKLRHSILQEAIEGKLTASWREQNPDVESASVLLEKIKQEKEQLVKEKKVKKGKKQPPNEIDNLLLKIPDSWTYPDLDDITQYITDGTHQTPTYTTSGRIFLSAQNVKPFRFIPQTHRYVSEKDYQAYIANRFTEKGDLLLGRVGAGIGETAVVDIDLEFAIYVSLGLVKTFKQYTNSNYLAIVFNSPYGVKYAKGNISSGGGSAGNFNLGRIRSFPIPLPSLKEQNEIVKKVETLFKICDELETQINSSKTNSQTLMQAVLKEAFEK